MFPNLRAEQARKGMTDTQVAEYLGTKRSTYGAKMRNGTFRVSEIAKLCRLFNCDFNYLFMTEEEMKCKQ